MIGLPIGLRLKIRIVVALGWRETLPGWMDGHWNVLRYTAGSYGRPYRLGLTLPGFALSRIVGSIAPFSLFSLKEHPAKERHHDQRQPKQGADAELWAGHSR
jgi:hypothetical protein